MKTAVYPDDLGSGAGTVTLAYEHDASLNHNRVIRTDQKGIVGTTTYDELKRMISRVFVDSGSTVLSESFSYDKNGNMLTANNGFVNVTNTYDGLGRIFTTTQTFVADNLPFTTQFGYTITGSGASAGSTRTLTYPNGRAVTESYDPRNRMVSVTGGAAIGSQWVYDGANRRSNAVLGNNVTSAFDYDINDRLTGITHASQGGNPLFDVDYGYDAIGNRLFARNNIHINRSQEYSYDRLNRLTSFKRGALDAQNTIPQANILDLPEIPGKRDWTLDKRGNWSTLVNTIDGSSETETRTVNEVNEYSTAAKGGISKVLNHDANGNLTLDPLAPNAGDTVPDGQRYEYDAANRLVKVWRTNGTGTLNDDLVIRENKYDALGRRVETRGPTYSGLADDNPFGLPLPIWTRWVFADLAPVHEYYTSSFAIVGQPHTMTLSREYIWGASYPEPVAMIDHTSDGDVEAGTPEVLHYLHDVLGNVVALTNAAGEVVERYDYDPYGKTYITDNTLTTYRGESKYGNPFMWTGQAFDQNTRQYHFWARTYSPHLGRWLHRDPLGYVDGVSLYQYVCSNPIKYIDPLGLITPRDYIGYIDELEENGYDDGADYTEEEWERILAAAKAQIGLGSDTDLLSITSDTIAFYKALIEIFKTPLDDVNKQYSKIIDEIDKISKLYRFDFHNGLLDRLRDILKDKEKIADLISKLENIVKTLEIIDAVRQGKDVDPKVFLDALQKLMELGDSMVPIPGLDAFFKYWAKVIGAINKFLDDIKDNQARENVYWLIHGQRPKYGNEPLHKWANKECSSRNGD